MIRFDMIKVEVIELDKWLKVGDDQLSTKSYINENDAEKEAENFFIFR